jgi:hypothetical protein
VRVRPDERVGEINSVALDDAAGEVFEVDLMTDADAGRHDVEALERLHPPLQKLVARAVAPKLHLHVAHQRVVVRPEIHLHRVVYDEIDRHERLDHFGIAPHALHRRAHRREIDQERHAREVLQEDARHVERHFLGALRRPLPVRQRAHVRLLDDLAVEVAQDGFEHDADRDGQP